MSGISRTGQRLIWLGLFSDEVEQKWEKCKHHPLILTTFFGPHTVISSLLILSGQLSQLSHAWQLLQVPGNISNMDTDKRQELDSLSNGTTNKLTSFKELPLAWRICIVLLCLLCLILLVAVIAIAAKPNFHPADSAAVVTDGRGCEETVFTEAKPSEGRSVFHDLTEAELVSIRDYVMNQPSLNLTAFHKASLQDNSIYAIELFLPDKAKVLKYLDEKGDEPERRARVIIIHGAAPSRVTEYIVGPLPNPNYYKTHSMKYRKTDLPFYGRPFTWLESKSLIGLMTKATETAYPLLKDSFNYWLHNCTDHCLFWNTIGQPGRKEPNKRYSWVQFNRKIKGMYLFGVPLQFLIDYTSAENQKIVEVVYNNQQFNSVEDMMSSYRNGSLKMMYLKEPTDEIKLRASLKRRGEPMPSVPKRGPAFVDPDGKRFSIHGNRLSYMNWGLSFGIRPTAGLGLFDVRFKGKRIAYEISLQEGVAYYSGYDPETSNTHYIDSTWGLGSSNTQLMRGIDCPENAVYLDSVVFMQTHEPVKKSGSICIFETNAGIPLWRHFDIDINKKSTGTNGMWFQGGLVDHAIVVRVVSTPFNYDYIFDYILHQNGVIEVKSTASGYINPAVYTPQEAQYGFMNMDHMIGTVHDHYMLYKVDLDIAGRKNSYQTVDVVAKNISYEWEANTYRIKKVVVKNKKKNEKDAVLRYDFNKPKYLVFMNENETNMYGNPKSYRIDIQNQVKQQYSDGYYMNDVVAWTKYQLSVTKHDDGEQFGSSIYNQNMFMDPAFNFDSIINDNESIEKEDLVAWVNIGGLHIPNTEDIPVTNTLGSSYKFLIKPFGYFDEDPSLGSTTAVLLDKEKDGTYKTYTYGTPESSSCPVPKRKVW